MEEKIIKTKKCIKCDSDFNIFETDIELMDKISPVID
jgi:hypothetical protein